VTVSRFMLLAASMRSWLLAIIAGLVFAGEVANYYLGTRTVVPTTGEGVIILVTAVVFMVFGVSLWHRAELGWWLISLSFFWFAAGAVVNYAYLRIDGSFPFPGPADALFLLIYPTAIAAFIVFLHESNLTVSVWDVLASVVVTAAVAASLLYPFIISPSSELHVSVFTRAVTIAYPIADALLFCMLLVLLLSLYLAGAAPVKYWLVLAGTMGVLISDSVSAYQSLNWAWYQPSAGDLGWFVWAACWALAVLVPRGTVLSHEPSLRARP